MVNQSQDYPTVTVGVVSFNRLNYLRAVLESAKECLQYPNLEWIVIDGDSAEVGLKEYLRGLTWINRLEIKPLSFLDSMNLLVGECKGKYLLLWPDDVQFFVRGPWLAEAVAALEEDSKIGCLSLTALRRKTIADTWSWRRFSRWQRLLGDLRRFGSDFRRQRVIRPDSLFPLVSSGWVDPGVIGAGILSLASKSFWQTLGPWRKAEHSPRLIDSSAGGEEGMVRRFQAMKLNFERVSPIYPVAADILNDEIGCKAKVRGGKRYGNYTAPAVGSYYYEIQELMEIQKRWPNLRLPLSFEDVVKPLGFSLPLNEDGDLLKASINQSQVCAI